jgi:hypothetical protein
MIIRTKKDAQNILDSIKEENLVVEYIKDDVKITIEYDEQSGKFIKTTGNSGIFIKSNGIYPEETALHLIFIDRKYINETIY